MFRRTAVALAIAGAWLLAPVSVYSDTDLTGLVNSAYFPRTESAELHELAHQRAQYQVAYSGGVCDGDGSLTHEGLTTHEVLACNGSGPERAVQQWIASPTHHAILADPSLSLIGCATAPGSDGSLFYACVLVPSNPPPPIEQIAPTPEPTIQSGEPVVAARSPKPTPVGSTPTAGATPVLLPNTALPETP